MLNSATLQSPRNARRGFTLTELAIVMGVIALLLGSISVATRAVSRQRLVGDCVNQIWQIANNIRNIYTGHPITGAPPGMAALIASGAFPQDMMFNGAPTNPWGGAYTEMFNNATEYEIDVAGLASPDMCAFLLSQIPSDGQDGAPTGIGYFAGTTFVSVTGLTPGAIANATAAANCSAVGIRFTL